MDTPTTAKDPSQQLAAHASAWEAYSTAIAELETAKAAHSRADNVHSPFSDEVREAAQRVADVNTSIALHRKSLRDASSNLLGFARIITGELNQTCSAALALARAQWEKNSVGAKLYAVKLREVDFAASPWRLALPHVMEYVEFPDRIEQVHDIGPSFAASVRVTWMRLVQMREAAKAVSTIKG